MGAGSHVYCKSISLNCPSDTILARLTSLKASGQYDDARSFPDIRAREGYLPYSFYFYDHTHNFLVRLEAPAHTPKNTEIHLAGIKYFNGSGNWQGFTEHVPKEKKKEVLAWFDSNIRPALGCPDASKHP
jgi:hypothetical protein